MATATYGQLNALQRMFQRRNFTVLAFPSNQFGRQEPGSGRDILNGVRYVRPGGNFVPNFPMFEKIDVNGENQHPLYAYLKSRCPSPQLEFADKERLMYVPQDSKDLRWNFEKFLIDVEGKPRKRYRPEYFPLYIADDIDELLKASGL